MNNFSHKKIGIWGFGVVGQSALTYFDQFDCTQIQILDTKPIDLPTTKNTISTLVQDSETIQTFLESNDLILHSPGIKLHDYQQFAHKFINELDILQDNKKNTCIIAITGTVGKTSITHLLENSIKHSYSDTIAAGNIGNPMLSLINNPSSCAKASANKPQHIILELSSFQLQPIKRFAPDLAIITNFFANHLDHHQSIEEYFDAKLNIVKFQNEHQLALLPLELIDQITSDFAKATTDKQEKISLKKNWALFNSTKPSELELEKYQEHVIYYLENKQIYRTQNNQTQQIFDISTLPPLTFDANWLVIVAACHLCAINLATISTVAQQIQLPDHRLQKIGSKDGSTFYNDSKSTVWQATLQAVNAMDQQTPIKLFLGGLSKGADRTPLLQALARKNIEIFAFGKEADQIAQLCTQFNITHQAHQTLDESWQTCVENMIPPCQILFSPGGSSFDLFADYKVRGQYFTKLAQNYLK